MSKKGIIVPGSESTNLTKGGGSYFSHKRSVIFKRFVKIHLRTLAHQVIKEIKRNIFYEVYFLLLLQIGDQSFSWPNNTKLIYQMIFLKKQFLWVSKISPFVI